MRYNNETNNIAKNQPAFSHFFSLMREQEILLGRMHWGVGGEVQNVPVALAAGRGLETIINSYDIGTEESKNNLRNYENMLFVYLCCHNSCPVLPEKRLSWNVQIIVTKFYGIALEKKKKIVYWD